MITTQTTVRPRIKPMNQLVAEGCVVIDNPPFSILAKIKAFYAERKIGYFLFAPHLTIFSSGGGKCGERYIVANANVIYENGAKVNTSFVTSLDASFIRTAPELKRAVEKASKEAAREKTKELPKYKYPYTVISAALLGKVSGVDFAVRKHECAFIRALDAQKSVGKTIFGAGFLISEGKAAELRAAELRAAEETIEWGLSEREQAIINQL